MSENQRVTVDLYVMKEIIDGLRLAANTLGSRDRTTAADRQIDFAERLAKWTLDQSQEIPKYIPN